MWDWLHDDRLQTMHSHAVAKRASTAIGRTSTVVRIGCCLVVMIAALVAHPSPSSWWLLLVVVPLIGTALAIAHAREDAIDWMVGSRLWPVQVVGRELMASSWSARLNVPGVLELIGPIPVMWMIGYVHGPFATSPAARLIATLAVLIYVWLSMVHWLLDSGFYAPYGRAPMAAFTRLLRGIGPIAYLAVYAWLMAANTSGALTALPALAFTMALAYPVVVVYEKFLGSAEIERYPAVEAQRLVDGMLVHSTISNPLHFVRIAAHERPAQSAGPLLVYLSSELQRCLRELDLGRREPALVTEIVEEVRIGLLPEYRERLVLAQYDEAMVLSPVDAVLARCVLADLACNALKEVDGDTRPTVHVDVEQHDMVVTIRVADNGPGLRDDWTPGPSLDRLARVLRSNDGALSFTPNDTGGTIVTARWALDHTMEVAR